MGAFPSGPWALAAGAEETALDSSLHFPCEVHPEANSDQWPFPCLDAISTLEVESEARAAGEAPRAAPARRSHRGCRPSAPVHRRGRAGTTKVLLAAHG